MLIIKYCKKIYMYGMRGNIPKWFESYFLKDDRMLLMMECNQKFYPSSVGFHMDRYLVLYCFLFT